MQVFHFETIDSTNEAAKRMIRDGKLREPSYLLAREQTAGKGTCGRSWASPKDAGIYLTVVELPFQMRVAPTGTFTLAAGVACVEALKQTTGIDVQLKPMNDLCVSGGKLGGILTEALIQSGSVEALITGVGINVCKVDRPVPAGSATPICLEELMLTDRFECLDLNALAATLVVKIRGWNAVVSSGRTAEVNRAWETYKVPGSILPQEAT